MGIAHDLAVDVFAQAMNRNGTLRREVELAERHHPRSRHLRHWASTHMSEGPLMSRTPRRAFTRRLQNHGSYCSIRAVRRHLAVTRQLMPAQSQGILRVGGAQAGSNPQRKRSGYRMIMNMKENLLFFFVKITLLVTYGETCSCNGTKLERAFLPPNKIRLFSSINSGGDKFHE